MLSVIIGAVALLLDQLLKLYAVSNIELNVGIKKIPGLIQLTHIKNFGAVFGIMKNLGILRWLALILLIAFTVAMILALKKGVIHSSLGRWSGILLLAGLLGNGLDRALYGYVVDMLEFKFGSFPIFNLADVLILVFGILFCVSLIKDGLDFSALHTAPAKAASPAREYSAAPSRNSSYQRPSREAPDPALRQRTRAAAEAQTGHYNRPTAAGQSVPPRSRAVREDAMNDRPVQNNAPRPQQTMSRPSRAEEEYLAARRARNAQAPVSPARREPAVDSSPTRVRRPITEEEIQPIRVSRPSSVQTAPVSSEPVRPAPAPEVSRPAPAPATETPRPAPVKPAAPAPKQDATDDFDLDSILAEFK